MAIRHPALLDRNRAALAVIDMQEAFAKIIPDFAEIAERIALLVQAVNLLKLPVIVTDNIPKVWAARCKQLHNIFRTVASQSKNSRFQPAACRSSTRACANATPTGHPVRH